MAKNFLKKGVITLPFLFLLIVFSTYTLRSSEQKEMKVIFVMSDECGYCLDFIPFTKKLHEKHKAKVEFISYYDNDSTDLLWQYRSYGMMSSLDVVWKKVYNADSLIRTLPLTTEGKPQTIIYKNNELISIILGGEEKQYKQIDSTLNALINEY